MTNHGSYAFYGMGMRLFGFERAIASFIEALELSCSCRANILDAGCGTGIVGISLMKKFPKSTLLATDLDKMFLDQTMLNSIRAGITKTRIKLGLSDITTPSKVMLINGSFELLKQSMFDVVSVGAAVGYSKDQEKTIRELLGLVKLGGYFLNIEMNERFFGRSTSLRYHYPIIPLVNMRKIIESSGYELKLIPLSIKYFPANLTRICLLARRK